MPKIISKSIKEFYFLGNIKDYHKKERETLYRLTINVLILSCR